MSKILEFRTSAQPTNVDLNARTISGVIVLSVGKIKDYRGYMLDEAFANDLLRSAKKQANGVMSNFGHNYDNLGKRLGRFSNFNFDGTNITADLKIFESADKSPGYEGMGSYVLSMAQEDPTAIMSSIRFSYNYEYQRDTTGKELKVNYYDKELGWISPNPDMGEVFLKFDALKSTDIVDEGAATNSLFSTQDELAEAARQLFNTPGIDQVLATHKFSQIEDYVNRNASSSSIVDWIKTQFGLSKSNPESFNHQNNTEVDTTVFNTKMDAANTEIAALKEALATANTKIESLSTAKTESATALEAMLARIDALERKPTDQHTGGDEEEQSFAKDKRNAHIDPITAELMGKFSKKSK